MSRKTKYSVVIDKDKDSDTIEALHSGEYHEGDTEILCTRKLDTKAKEPIIAAVVDIIRCVAKKMKGKDYELSYLMSEK